MKKIIVFSLLVLWLFAPTVTAQLNAQSAEDNILRIACVGEPVSLDVHEATTVAQRRYVTDLGATLVALDPATGAPVPYLATDWEVSADGLVWTFHLREDVKFHDGTPLTAVEYAWTFNRILTGDHAAPKAFIVNVTAARAVDTYTLELTLKAPDSAMLINLENTFLQPLSPQAVESAGEDYGQHPVGVGPFRFKEWVPGERIVLERNPDFTWGPAFTSGGPAKLDGIEYIVTSNYDVALIELLEGRLDLMQVQQEDIPQVLESENLVLEVDWMPGTPWYLTINLTKPPLDDLRVRQALNYAVDREQLVSMALLGYGEPAYGPLVPRTVGYWSGTEEIGYHYDPDKARALLAEVGYELNADGLLEKDGAVLSLTAMLPNYADFPHLPYVMDLIADQFRQVGIEMNVVRVDVKDQLSDVADPTKYHLSMHGMGRPQATTILMQVYHTGSSSNASHVSDPELDRLIEDSITSLDQEVGRQALWDAQKQIIEYAYAIPLYDPPRLYGLNNQVKGYLQAGYTRWLIDTYIE